MARFLRSGSHARCWKALAASVLMVATAAGGATLPGGGPKRTDCLAQLAVSGEGFPAGGTFSGATCTDGTSCDADGVVNGVCEIPAAICLSMTTPGCTAKPVANVRLRFAIHPKADAAARTQLAGDIAALAAAANTLAGEGGTGVCTGTSVLRLPVGAGRSRQLFLRLRAKGDAKFGGLDVDRYTVVCAKGDPNASTTTTTTTTLASTTTTPATTTTTTLAGVPGTPTAGLVSQITAVAIDGTGTVTVTFTLTDAEGHVLTPVGSSTTDPNRARVRFTIARLETVPLTVQTFTTVFTRWRNYVTRHVTDDNTHLESDQPTMDTGGTFATIDALNGLYTYTLKTKLTQGYDATLTHRVAGQVGRTYADESLTANPIYDFVPAGGSVTTQRELTTTEQCNSCHNPLSAHGGGRRDVRFCQTCHTDQAIDVATGNSIDLKVMVHRIHAGKDLPSVAAGAVGTSYAIGDNTWAEKVTACVGGPLPGVKCTSNADCGTGGTCTGSKVDGVGFPQDLRSCTTCHGAGATASHYASKPSAAACASCHDDVNPGLTTTAAGPPGTGHPAGPLSDAVCVVCHKGTADAEYDVTVPGAHTVPERSAQLAGLRAQILDASAMAGTQVTVHFKITNDAGTPLTNLSGLSRVAFAISGPTSPDFGSTTAPSPALAPTAVGGGSSGTLSTADGNGVFTYTTAASLPGNATGTWRIGIEARRSVTIGQGSEVGPKTLNEAAQNVVLDFSVDGSPVVHRRIAVDIDKCKSCHGTFSEGFSVHGNLRNQTEYCAICHNPSASDFSQRKNVANADPNTATISLKHMIHKVHTGEELSHAPYVIYGFNGSANDFSEVRFPGDRSDCTTCHTTDAYLLPLPSGVHPTLQTQVSSGSEVLVSSVPPIQDACLSCHDSDAAAAHAETNTTGAGAEACQVCHGEGALAPVSEVHHLPR